MDAPPPAFRLTVPARFDGRDHHRGRSTLHVQDGRIVAASAASAAHLDLSDLDVTLLPGVIDAHVHLAITNTDPSERTLPPGLLALRMARNARAQLRAGVTTVRDLGAPDGLDLQWRQALADGLVPGPRTIVAGRPIVAVGGHCAFMGRQVGNVAAARAAAEQAVAEGVDWLKLMVTAGLSTPGAAPHDQQLPVEVIAAVVEVAHAAGLPVAAHAVGGPGVLAAITAGVDSLEHGYWLGDAEVAAMLARGTVYVPTRTVAREVADGVAVADARPPAAAQASARHADAVHPESVRRAYRAGVTIAAGTDYRHGSLPGEVALLVSAGMAPRDALRAATSAAAQLLRRPDLGSLEIGAVADLLLVRGDPLTDPRALQDAVLVVQGGQLVWHDPTLQIGRSIPEGGAAMRAAAAP